MNNAITQFKTHFKIRETLKFIHSKSYSCTNLKIPPIEPVSITRRECKTKLNK